jgi:putative membrane protein
MIPTVNWPALIVQWLILAFSVWVAAEIVGGIYLKGVGSTLAVAAILGLLNLYVTPVLKFVSTPITILTLGLFTIVINAAMFGLTDWIANIDDDIRFNVDGVGAALLGAIIISFVGMVLGVLIRPNPV